MYSIVESVRFTRHDLFSSGPSDWIAKNAARSRVPQSSWSRKPARVPRSHAPVHSTPCDFVFPSAPRPPPEMGEREGRLCNQPLQTSVSPASAGASEGHPSATSVWSFSAFLLPFRGALVLNFGSMSKQQPLEGNTLGGPDKNAAPRPSRIKTALTEL